MEELIAAVNKANVWTMENVYSIGTDVPVTELYISLGAQSKHVYHMGSGCKPYHDPAPMELCDLEHTIETIVNTSR